MSSSANFAVSKSANTYFSLTVKSQSETSFYSITWALSSRSQAPLEQERNLNQRLNPFLEVLVNKQIDHTPIENDSGWGNHLGVSPKVLYEIYCQEQDLSKVPYFKKAGSEFLQLTNWITKSPFQKKDDKNSRVTKFVHRNHLVITFQRKNPFPVEQTACTYG